jgi:hypothetical protein
VASASHDKGNKGAYAKGSHYIKGLRDMAGLDSERVHDILMNDTHRYAEKMVPHAAMEKLALFVTTRFVDPYQLHRLG